MITFDGIRINLLRRATIVVLFIYSLLIYSLALCISAASIIEVFFIVTAYRLRSEVPRLGCCMDFVLDLSNNKRSFENYLFVFEMIPIG
jgi:hypothetical protein